MLLAQLMREAFLWKTDNGAYVALPTTRQQAKAHLPARIRLPHCA
jgi:hypothetical protein